MYGSITFQGEHIYSRASAKLKRVQCNMGAKCVSVVMPDAHKETLFKQVRNLVSVCGTIWSFKSGTCRILKYSRRTE